MSGNKPWYASRTVWGALVAIACALTGLWGFEVSPQDQERAVEMIVQGAGAIGGLVALVGRFAARRAIA